MGGTEAKRLRGRALPDVGHAKRRQAVVQDQSGNNFTTSAKFEFAAYGVTFDHVYRYIDIRDPWPENYGISNGWAAEAYAPGTLGTVIFTNPTPYVTIDWWDISTNQIHVWAYDSGNSLLDSFAGPTTSSDDSGTTTLSGGLISYMTFNDGGGYVQIANMTYAPIPAPGALLLGSMGMGIVGWLRKRRML